MNNKNLSIHIQLADGQQAETGIHEQNNCVLAVSDKIALMVLAQSNSGIEYSAALKAVEILIDDMQTNLSPSNGNSASTCLNESIDNVNDFLYEQYMDNQFSAWDVATSLSAIQYWDGKICCFQSDEFVCLLLHAGELIEMGGEKADNRLLGENDHFETHVLEHNVLQGDVLLMAKTSDIETIGQEFVGMTLSWFSDNLQGALGKINQKAKHHGLSHPPGLILARIENLSTMGGWMGKLRNR